MPRTGEVVDRLPRDVLQSFQWFVTKEHRVFGTTTPDILELAEWLESASCTHVAIESSGSYWKPIYNLLVRRTQFPWTRN